MLSVVSLSCNLWEYCFVLLFSFLAVYLLLD